MRAWKVEMGAAHLGGFGMWDEAERVLFGSDAPWQDSADVLARFLRLPFSDDEREDILHRNAERLFRLSTSEGWCRT